MRKLDPPNYKVLLHRELEDRVYNFLPHSDEVETLLTKLTRKINDAIESDPALRAIFEQPFNTACLPPGVQVVSDNVPF